MSSKYETESYRKIMQRIKAKAVTLLAGLIVLGSCQFGYQKPESVDTPPLASLPRTEWPEHGLNAVKRGLVWGQCGTCGFPVTMEDTENGFGDIIWMGGGRLPWGEFSCYRHVSNLKPSVYILEGVGNRWHLECGFPHSWDREMEYIIDTQKFRIYYG